MTAIQESGFEILEHPPYSPDLAPSDFYLFPRLKEHPRGKKFEDNNEVMAAVEEFSESQSKDFFFKGILGLAKRWTKCIDLLGDYVEKYIFLIPLFTLFIINYHYFWITPRTNILVW